MPKSILIDTTRCTACRGCQVACKDWHGLPAIKTKQTGTHQNPPDLNPCNFKIVRFSEHLDDKGVVHWNFFPDQCRHCTNPPCVRVCPTQATYQLPNGIVTMDYHRCIGCRFCMAGCPYGARSFNFIDPRGYMSDPVSNPEYPTRMIGVVEKCTFCVERLAKGLMPACVEASNGKILFGDLDDPNSSVRKALAENYTIRRKPSLGTQPGVYYIV